jgi:hypothetical protein
MLFSLRSIVLFCSSIAASRCVCGPGDICASQTSARNRVVTSACDAGAVGAGRRRYKLRGIAAGRRSVGHAGTPYRAKIVHLGEQFYVRLHGRKAAGRVAGYVCQRVLPLLEAGTKADVAGSPDRVLAV